MMTSVTLFGPPDPALLDGLSRLRMPVSVQTLDDLANFMAGKILSALGFDHDLYPPWTGKAV